MHHMECLVPWLLRTCVWSKLSHIWNTRPLPIPTVETPTRRWVLMFLLTTL